MDKNYFETLANSIKESNNTDNKRSSHSDTAFLTVKVDIDCKLFCDGDFLDLVEANKVKKIPIEVGQHLITIESENFESVSEDREVSIDEPEKNYLLNVNDLRTREAEAARLAEEMKAEEERQLKEEEFKREEEMRAVHIASRVVFDKTYCIKCCVDNYGERRLNPDGTEFYPTKCIIIAGEKRYIIPETLFLNDVFITGPMAPAISIDVSNGNITVFIMQKDSNNQAYSMEGFIYTIKNDKISRITLFSKSNYGWFPSFTIKDGLLSLNIFSFSGYKPMCAIYKDNNWFLQDRNDILEKSGKDTLDKIVNEQNQNGLIFIN